MSTIIQLLIAEHAVFALLFDEIEAVLDEAQSPQEVNRLAHIVEGVLKRHGHSEAELAYAALDQMLAESGELHQLHQDHREIDLSLARATVATDLDEAKSLLERALRISRAHFRREEGSVFPLFARAFHSESLESFGNTMLQRYLDADLEPEFNPSGFTRSGG